MDKIFFVLGRYPSISQAEIQEVLNKNNLEFSQSIISDEVSVISLVRSGSVSDIFPTLAGSVKTGIVLDEVSLNAKETVFQKFLDADFLTKKIIPQGVKKIHFGISIYNAGSEKQILDKLAQSLPEFNKTIKNNLRAKGLSSGFLRIKGRQLSSVAVEKNRLLDAGFELILIACADKIIIGKTTMVQNYTDFTFRDIQRPKKDKKSGILPVKLARMMVNLLPFKPESLLDPFCGSGTILLESALLGIKKLIGTDIEDRAVSDSGVNLEWLFREYRLNQNEYQIMFKKADSRTLDKSFGKNTVDAIVTEPYLGPPLNSAPSLNQAEQYIRNLSPLYKESLNAFFNLLKNNGRIVIILPVYYSAGKTSFIDRKLIFGSSFKIINTFIYNSPGQFVGREIFLLEKT